MEDECFSGRYYAASPKRFFYVSSLFSYPARAGISENRLRTAIIRETQSESPRRAILLEFRNTRA